MDNADDDRQALFGPNAAPPAAGSNQPPAAREGGVGEGGEGRLSWASVRNNIEVKSSERRRGLRSAYESTEVGREVLERLDDQKGQREGVTSRANRWLRSRRLVEYLDCAAVAVFQVVVCVTNRDA